MWIGHLTVYGLPSLFYLCTFFNVDLIKYIYVMSMNTIQDMPFVMFGFTSLMLVLAAVNRTQGTFSAAEMWSVASMYMVVSTATGFVQRYFNKTLNRWYFGDQAINKQEDQSNFDDEFEEIIDDSEGFIEFLRVF